MPILDGIGIFFIYDTPFQIVAIHKVYSILFTFLLMS